MILFYERALHKETSQLWIDRCRTQIAGVLDVLEKERAGVSTPYWHGTAIGHADIAVACALRFVRDAHPGVFSEQQFPALTAHAAQCEAMAVFKEISQEFIPPKGDAAGRHCAIPREAWPLRHCERSEAIQPRAGRRAK